MNTKTYTSGVRTLTAGDFYFDDEIQKSEDNLNFYMAFQCNVDCIFGTSVETDTNDHYLNVYANFDTAHGTVCEDLDIILVKGTDEAELKYRLSQEELELIRKEMDSYLQAQGWITLDHSNITIEFGVPYGTVRIATENSSGCIYEDVLTTKDLEQSISDYIQKYFWGGI